MGRAKHVFTILLLSYLASMIVFGFVERLYVQENARQLNNFIRTASDMALEQAQVTDDFFAADDSFMVGRNLNDGHDIFRFKAFTGPTMMTDGGLYEIYTGQSTKGDIYNHMYTSMSSNFRNQLRSSGSSDLTAERIKTVKFPYFQYNQTNYTMETFYKPAILQMGLAHDSTAAANNGVQGRIDDGFGNEFGTTVADLTEDTYRSYELNDVVKYSYVGGASGEIEDYYLTPLALGITYLDKDLIQQLFINNMNLMMRAAYINNNNNTVNGGVGLFKGGTYAQDIQGLQGTNNQFVNNGKFSIKVGQQGSNNLYLGTEEAEVEYKVIDMYDNNNSAILKQVLGVQTEEKLTGRKTAIDPNGYGDYYKSIDALNQLENRAGNATQQASTKPMVVAKVTFYLDVVIPYNTITMRELRAYNSENSTNGVKNRLMFEYDSAGLGMGTDKNFLDLKPRQVSVDNSYTISQSDINTPRDANPDGTRRVKYTTLFAVAP